MSEVFDAELFEQMEKTASADTESRSSAGGIRSFKSRAGTDADRACEDCAPSQPVRRKHRGARLSAIRRSGHRGDFLRRPANSYSATIHAGRMGTTVLRGQ